MHVTKCYFVNRQVESIFEFTKVNFVSNSSIFITHFIC